MTRILIIDDDEDDYTLVRDLLGDAFGESMTLDWATTYERDRKSVV